MANFTRLSMKTCFFSPGMVFSLQSLLASSGQSQLRSQLAVSHTLQYLQQVKLLKQNFTNLYATSATTEISDTNEPGELLE